MVWCYANGLLRYDTAMVLRASIPTDTYVHAPIQKRRAREEERIENVVRRFCFLKHLGTLESLTIR
jgi:hypothetical protein